MCHDPCSPVLVLVVPSSRSSDSCFLGLLDRQRMWCCCGGAPMFSLRRYWPSRPFEAPPRAPPRHQPLSSTTDLNGWTEWMGAVPWGFVGYRLAQYEEDVCSSVERRGLTKLSAVITNEVRTRTS